jgi:hypothetical protein
MHTTHFFYNLMRVIFGENSLLKGNENLEQENKLKDECA